MGKGVVLDGEVGRNVWEMGGLTRLVFVTCLDFLGGRWIFALGDGEEDL
jgi:hypothetical protein